MSQTQSKPPKPTIKQLVEEKKAKNQNINNYKPNDNDKPIDNDNMINNDDKFFEKQAKKRLDEIMESKKIDGEYVCDRNKMFEEDKTNSAKAVCYNALSILYGLIAMKQEDAFKNILNDKKYRIFLKQIFKNYDDDAIRKDFSINMKNLYNDDLYDDKKKPETFKDDYDGNKFSDLKRIKNEVRKLWFGGKRRRSRKSRTSKRKRTKRAKKSKKRNTRRK